ncbi:MAG: glycoside hydrolase family 3 C-terminal domain-containing protein [Myxococcota bacterium]|nr:glycoside hydrolase family 3 C-terminal domain-containing protein [Myxococcota bacterium]
MRLLPTLPLLTQYGPFTGVRATRCVGFATPAFTLLLWLNIGVVVLVGCNDDTSIIVPESDARTALSDVADISAVENDSSAIEDTSSDVFDPEADRLARLEAFCPVDSVEVEARIDVLMEELTLEEKTQLMVGTGAFPEDGVYASAGVERLELPGIRMVDGPRGVSHDTGNATVFPVAMARAATWDPELERSIGQAIAIETAARGGDVLLAPTTNILRHPRWGRAQETYGEDPVQLTAFGVAFVQGVQAEGVMASAKHYAANSIEDTRFDVDVAIDERTLRELYLPHFEAMVRDAHLASLMTSYNAVNGDFCSENSQLLSILKDEWGFLGFVESDWIFGTYNTVKAANAGLDIEMPVPKIYGPALESAVEKGDVDESRVDAAVRRILRAQLCYRLDSSPKVKDPARVETAAHLQLSREAATRAMVLLKNTNGLLPLASDTADVVLVGPFANVPNLGDNGSSEATPTNPVTPYEGLVEVLGESQVLLLQDTETEESQAALAAASVIVAVVGLSAADEGEGMIAAGDRPDMQLPEDQRVLLEALAAQDVPVVVVMFGGTAITVESWFESADAVVMAWYPGAEGGHAIADVLLGVEAPYGRMPIAVPVAESDLPPFDNVSLEVTYDYWHGYRHLDREGTTARFPLGYGLTYSTLEYTAMRLSSDTATTDETVRVAVDITNTGDRLVNALVQVYSSGGVDVERAVKDLRAFDRLDVPPGETKTAEIDVSVRAIARYWADEGWQEEPGDYVLRAGAHADALSLQSNLLVSGSPR